jgi:hypothetical protein
MNPKGKKNNGEKIIFASLQRINKILDGEQQREFNSWVHRLATKNSNEEKYPFSPKSGYAFVAKINDFQFTMVAKVDNTTGSSDNNVS